MGKKSYNIFSNQPFVFILFLLYNISTCLYATNHIINFGGTFGTNYSPNELNVAVGDTVTWQGAFSGHPLSSLAVPQGAGTFHNGSGSTFSYLVQLPGNYNYECDIHALSGMTGSFTATVSSIEENGFASKVEKFNLEQNYPNPFNPSTVINYQLSKASVIELSVYNILGEKIVTLVSENQSPGKYHVEWDASNISSGIYFYRIQAGEFVQTRRMLLAK